MGVKAKYEETDTIGKHTVIEQDNGIKIRILKEPSTWYKEKQAARKAADDIRVAAEEAERKRKRKIELKSLINAGTEIGVDVTKEQAELDALMAG